MAYGDRVMLATSMKIGLCLSLQRKLAYEDRVSYAYEDKVTSFSTRNTHSTTAALKGSSVLYIKYRDFSAIHSKSLTIDKLICI